MSDKIFTTEVDTCLYLRSDMETVLWRELLSQSIRLSFCLSDLDHNYIIQIMSLGQSWGSRACVMSFSNKKNMKILLHGLLWHHSLSLSFFFSSSLPFPFSWILTLISLVILWSSWRSEMKFVWPDSVVNKSHLECRKRKSSGVAENRKRKSSGVAKNRKRKSSGLTAS